MFFLGGTIITAFSIPNNWYRLTSVNESPDARKLRPIQGIRFYNMISVIMCHSIMVALAGPTANTKDVENVSYF